MLFFWKIKNDAITCYDEFDKRKRHLNSSKPCAPTYGNKDKAVEAKKRCQWYPSLKNQMKMQDSV